MHIRAVIPECIFPLSLSLSLHRSLTHIHRSILPFSDVDDLNNLGKKRGGRWGKASASVRRIYRENSVLHQTLQ